MRKIKIIYHNDFDGLASAGLLTRFFGWHYSGSITVECLPIDYENKDAYLAESFEGLNVAVVDFLFHPEASWWFDHHTTTFLDRQNSYEESNTHYWEDTTKSCPSLLLEFFSKYYPSFRAELGTECDDLCRYSDMIDSAMYESVSEALNYDNNFISFNMILAGERRKLFIKGFIEAVAKNELADFFCTPTFVAEKASIQNDFESYKADIKTHVTLSKGKYVILDVIDSDLLPNRYISYYFYPDAEYTITLAKRADGYYLGVGRNPWKEDSTANIGELLQPFGGGGRQNVGAVLISEREKIRSVCEQVLQTLDLQNH